MNLRRKGGVKPGGVGWRVGGAGERAGGTLTPAMCGKGADKLAPLSSHSWGGKRGGEAGVMGERRRGVGRKKRRRKRDREEEEGRGREEGVEVLYCLSPVVFLVTRGKSLPECCCLF